MTLQGPSGGSLHPGVHGAGPHSGPQDPGPHGHDPGPSFHPQQHVPARPVFYIHPPPPPPPFLHYQWPMPFPPYNPFGGFPGMGYGMVMPSFPPPPYMDASAYLLPQPHIQPVDYRRLIHPQAHPPGAPFHNRVRPPHVAPPRETVNSEVQTEPPHREAGGYGGGSLLASSDSGHGTASSSPSSSSSPLKRHSEGQTLPRTDADDFQVDEAGKSSTLEHGGGGGGVPLPVKPVHSHVGATLETERSRAGPTAPERVPSSSCSGAHCRTWSVSSLDGSAPICCSSQEENEDPRERRVSIPDILMSWAGGTPQSKVIKMTQVHPHCNHQGSSQTEPERDGPLYPSPAVTPGMTDSSPAEGVLRSKVSETFYKILKPKMSEELEESDETSPEEDAAAEVLHNRVPLNSSVWSVDSLPPYTPSGEWLLQNGLLGPQVIVEMREELEGYAGSTGGDDPKVGAGRVKQHRWLPSAPMADGCLASSTPAQPPPRGPALDCETPQMKEPTCGLTPEDVPLVSTTGLRCPLPVGEQSPDQEALLVTERKETSVCPRALEDVLFSSPAFRKEPDHPSAGSRAASETEGGDTARLRTEQLSVPPAPQPETKVSPSKGHLVDCGVQCPDLQEPVHCEAPTGTRRQPLKYSGGKMAAAEGQAGGSGKNGHVQRNPKRTNYGRSRGSGGTGRNPRSKY